MTHPHAHLVGEVVARSPVFPPSFDGSPVMFGWALFSRLLILLLASATIVRLVSRTRVEGLHCDSPAFYSRLVIICLLSAASLGCLSDVSTWLAWGEVEDRTMTAVMTLGRVLDGLSSAPFIMALFVPFWMHWLRRCRVIRPTSPQRGLSDSRVTWGQLGVPLSLAAWSALGAFLVTGMKWYTWSAAHVGG